MTKKLAFPKILFWSGAISLILVYIVLWGKMIKTPSERTGTDFIAFYTAGRVAQEYGIPNVYKTHLQKEVQEAVLGFPILESQTLLYNHLPFLIPILKIMILENYPLSFFLWALLQIAIYAVSFFTFAKLIPETPDKKNKLNIILSAILFFPIFVSILLGQDTAFLFLGISLFSYGIIKKKDFFSGLGLALSTVRPHLTLVFAIPLFFRNKKAFLYFFGSTSLLASFSLAILGLEGTKNFIRILTISSEGKWSGMSEVAMLNLIGLITRVFPELNTEIIHTIGWGAYILSIIFLSIIWLRKNMETTFLLTVSVLSSIFFAPHLHYHDLSLMILPILLILLKKKHFISKENIPLAILLVSFILVFTQPISLLYYALPYLLAVVMIVVAYKSKGWHPAE